MDELATEQSDIEKELVEREIARLGEDAGTEILTV
jgi:hypothetical protein